MKIRFENTAMAYFGDSFFIKKYKKHWWSQWQIVMDRNNRHPQIYRRINGEFIAV